MSQTDTIRRGIHDRDKYEPALADYHTSNDYEDCKCSLKPEIDPPRRKPWFIILFVVEMILLLGVSFWLIWTPEVPEECAAAIVSADQFQQTLVSTVGRQNDAIMSLYAAYDSLNPLPILEEAHRSQLLANESMGAADTYRIAFNSQREACS